MDRYEPTDAALTARNARIELHALALEIERNHTGGIITRAEALRRAAAFLAAEKGGR